MDRQKGFTLLELLMVVIIMGILASIAFPQYIKASEKSRAAEAIQLLGAIRASEERYRAQSPGNVYTGAIADLDLEMPTTTQFWGAAVALTATNAVFTRKGGAFNDNTVGIVFATGNLCGTFPPLFVTAVSC